MRVIERKMIAAIQAGKGMRAGNTRVEIANTLGNWRVYLHGNLIANGGSAGFSFTLAGWNTPTTRSRVNALLEGLTGARGVYCKAFEPHYCGAPIGSRDWISVERAY